MCQQQGLTPFPSAGYLVNSDSGSSTVIFTGSQPTAIAEVHPLAVSDGGKVLGDDLNATDVSNSLCLWANNTNTLLSRLVPAKYHGRIRFPRGPTDIPWINDQGDIIVDAELCGTTDPSHPKWVGAQLFWHNALAVAGESDPSISFVQLPQETTPMQFNNNANFAGIAAAAPDNGADHTAAALLLPVELMVDANRDGQMSFTDPAIHDRDGTTAAKPYRFWINNDHDNENSDAPVVNNQTDSALENIVWKRDLEDYARLWINLKGLTAMVSANSGISVGLQFKPLSGDTWQGSDPRPSIKIFKAVESDGGTNYVTDDSTANLQISGDYDVPMEDPQSNSVVGTSEFILPNDFWADVDDTHPKHLIFEGVTAGKGRLVMVFYKGTQKIGEGGALYMDLRDIKNMYERWTVDPPSGVPAAGADPLQGAVISTRALPAGQAKAFTYDAQSPEEKEYIIFAHGWNMASAEKDMFAETAYKRLWWQGYKGRFAAFQWPTTYGFNPTGSDWNTAKTLGIDRENYDNGEHIAWRSARWLENLLIQFNSACPGKVYLMGHSMGNVVAGEALRLLERDNGKINTYVACQAAVEAECYDPTTATNFPLHFDYEHPLQASLGQNNPGSINYGPTTPNIYPNWLTPGSGGVQTKANFYNVNDFALYEDIWEFNEITKPDNTGLLKKWGYGATPQDNRFFRTVIGLIDWTFLDLGDQADVRDRYEIMAHAAEPRSRALRRTPGNIGGFVQTLDLQTVWPEDSNPDPSTGLQYKRGEWHSGEFLFTNMNQKGFWRSLVNAFGLLPPP